MIESIAASQTRAASRPHALDNTRFRALLLWLAGVPIALMYVAKTVVEPIFTTQAHPTDFPVYLRAAHAIATGADPYTAFFNSPILDPTKNGAYIYPPVVAWALQPLTALDAHAAYAGALVALQLCFAFSLWLILRTLDVRDRQLQALCVLLAMASFSVRVDMYEAQVNPVLLALTATWFWCWSRGSDSRAGLALGVGVAIKLMQAPLLLLAIARRRFDAVVAALATLVAISAVAAAQYLPEYVERVLPRLSGGSGYFGNSSPAAAVERVVNPSSFLGQFGPTSAASRLTWVAVALVVLGAGWIVLRRRPERRIPEAALAVAMVPLTLSVVNDGMLTLELLPFIILLVAALRGRDWTGVSLVAAAWALMNPVHMFSNAVVAAHHPAGAVLADSVLVAEVLLWVAAVRWVQRAVDSGAGAASAVG